MAESGDDGTIARHCQTKPECRIGLFVASLPPLPSAPKTPLNIHNIVTCLDPRCVPENFFHVGSDLGLGAIRNAGGRATADAIRSIVALRTLADIRAVFVVHHTDCGMTHMTNAQIIEDVKKRTPGAANAVNALVGVTGGFGCFTEVEFEETIKEDVRILRGEKMLEGVEIRGLAFDIQDGVVRVVE